MKSREKMQQQMFKEILYKNYKLSTEVEDITIHNLVEQIKQDLIIVMNKNKESLE